MWTLLTYCTVGYPHFHADSNLRTCICINKQINLNKECWINPRHIAESQETPKCQPLQVHGSVQAQLLKMLSGWNYCMCANVGSFGIVACGMMFRIQALTHIQIVRHTVLLEWEKENFVDFVGSKTWVQTENLLYPDSYKGTVQMSVWKKNVNACSLNVLQCPEYLICLSYNESYSAMASEIIGLKY